ncbi:CIA30 family protein [Pseudohongiella spirulinae]|uniref:NADH:ubiquinone oxidoreductase complex I intermediate-associated protein 30 n=1 Tax=Pseudohongiella spirulinae TaxID=1249552 RepID=A0A0S2KC90_9GAMM|nr:CIA30 family protein [Pseudohongiella spirulinae]ALO45943.1 NADH:ubiquinone oxidoreductase complex I intermediate-associated protein 30 [Pseudohongiella spirulinae]
MMTDNFSSEILDIINTAEWRAVNDDVMGGQSSSLPTVVDDKLHFSGIISLENNGGFASIRSQQHLDLSDFSGLTLRVCGDGRRYQFRLYTDATFHDSKIAYSMSFNTTADQWQDVTVDFSKLKPVFRGRLLSGPAFDAARVEQIGFLLADKQAGKFHLRVAWMRTQSN